MALSFFVGNILFMGGNKRTGFRPLDTSKREIGRVVTRLAGVRGHRECLPGCLLDRGREGQGPKRKQHERLALTVGVVGLEWRSGCVIVLIGA